MVSFDVIYRPFLRYAPADGVVRSAAADGSFAAGSVAPVASGEGIRGYVGDEWRSYFTQTYSGAGSALTGGTPGGTDWGGLSRGLVVDVVA